VCSRHACPFDRSKTASTNAAQALAAANGEGQHFYRKEFATITDGAQRPRPARPPPGELSLDTTVSVSKVSPGEKLVANANLCKSND